MARIPRDIKPFYKWDPDGHQTRARAQARAQINGEDPRRTDAAAGRIKIKKWVLRWAWLLSTGVLLLGYGIMAIMLSGKGGWIGV